MTMVDNSQNPARSPVPLLRLNSFASLVDPGDKVENNDN